MTTYDVLVEWSGCDRITVNASSKEEAEKEAVADARMFSIKQMTEIINVDAREIEDDKQ
jgi:hypothetical protein